jgi:hypothetical protein
MIDPPQLPDNWIVKIDRSPFPLPNPAAKNRPAQPPFDFRERRSVVGFDRSAFCEESRSTLATKISDDSGGIFYQRL